MPELLQLAPQRVRSRRISLLEFSELLPNVPLSPEEDEAKNHEYELRQGHSPVVAWPCDPNSRTGRGRESCTFFCGEPAGYLGTIGYRCGCLGAKQRFPRRSPLLPNHQNLKLPSFRRG